ncbi:MAG: hypothetical protein ACOC9Y_06615 [Chloroflexota bacterium]
MARTARKRSSSRTTITRREFFAAVRDRVQERLPAGLNTFRIQVSHRQMKLYYHRHKLHYEVWTNGRDDHIEIGLHFEEGPELTERLIRHFDRDILEIKHELGPQVELERWTRSWGRIFQLLPYQPLTEELATAVGDRLHDMITTLQPLLEEAVNKP